MQAQQARNTRPSETGQYLTFYLGDEAFGVDILRVQEIRGWEPVRPLPDIAEDVKGVLDLRGTIVPIVDLRMRFGNPSPVYESTTVVIIVSVGMPQGHRQLIGMVVDAVSDVLDTSESQVQTPPDSLEGIGKRYMTGMVSLDQGMVVLMDVDRVLGSHQIGDLGQPAV